MITAAAPTTMEGLRTYLGTIVSDINLLWSAVASYAFAVSVQSIVLDGADSIVAVDVPLEVIILSCASASSLGSITAGRSGQIKVMVADSADLTITHSTGLVLKGAADLSLNSGDIVALINVGGDPETAAEGTWRELFRTLF